MSKILKEKIQVKSEKRNGNKGRWRTFLFDINRGVWQTFALLLFSFTLFAQPKDNAPYSRLGLGEPVGHTLSTAGWGGLSAAYIDGLHINILNPASYGWLGAATFEAGMFAERSKIKINDESSSNWGGNLSHIALAFPMRNSLNDVLENKQRKFYWGMNLALLPNTSIGYDIQTEEAGPVSDSILNVFQGTGGTNKLVWGNGIRYKNFSAGINLSYVFGQLERKRQVFIRDLGPSFHDEFIDNISLKSLQVTLGFQYRLELAKKELEDGRTISDHNLVFGLYGNPSARLSTRGTKLRIGVYDLLSVSDTLLNENDLEQSGKLPSEWTFGLMYTYKDKVRAGIEYGVANWSKYENEAKPEDLFNSNRFALGVEFSPNATSYNNYFKRIRYRAGFFYKDDPRLEDLTQYALTFGIGLPVILPRGQTSFVSLAVELGRYNTDNQINEDYVKMSLGFTLNDGTWFYKRKFR